MVDAIIGLFVLAGYIFLGLLGIFVLFWLMVGAYVVAHDITHKHEWKHEEGEVGGEIIDKIPNDNERLADQ